MATDIKTPATIQELEENRAFVAETFKIMGEYLEEFLITDDMKKDFENAKWNILGSYDADISHEKNMKDIKFWHKLHNDCEEHLSLAN